MIKLDEKELASWGTYDNFSSVTEDLSRLAALLEKATEEMAVNDDLVRIAAELLPIYVAALRVIGKQIFEPEEAGNEREET